MVGWGARKGCQDTQGRGGQKHGLLTQSQTSHVLPRPPRTGWGRVKAKPASPGPLQARTWGQ